MTPEDYVPPETFLALADKYLWVVLIVLFSLILLWRGLIVVGEQIRTKGIGSNNLQAFGLVVILPAILIMSTNSDVPSELPATLIGALAGYIFGVRNG